MKLSLKAAILPHAAPIAAIILCTLTVYLRILGHDFQLFWDDEKYVTGSEMVRGFTLGHLKNALKGSYGGNYAPVQTLSYMADYTIWGMKAAGFFLTNILLHIGNGLVFYAILVRLGLNKFWASSSALLFLLHPVQAETVAWVSERKNLLAMFFCLLAFAAYLVYRDKGWGRGKMAYLLCLSAFSVALLSKAIAVVFPVMLCLYDYCYEPDKVRRSWLLDKIPFICAALLMAWLTIRLQTPGDIPGGGGGRTGYYGGSLYATFLTMLVVLCWYMRLLFWPAQLSAMYDPPIKTMVDGQVALGALLLVLVVAVGVYLYLKQRKLFFWYALFFVGLLPVSQIVPIVTLMNDRYLYFPMLGASVFLASLVVPVEKISGTLYRIATVAFGLILVVLGFLTYERAGVWKNDLTFWSDAARKSPGNYVALYGLGQALQNSGNLEAARALYLRVLALNPRHVDTLMHLGYLSSTQNMPLQGRPYLVDVTRYYPTFPDGHLALGKNYYATGELALARSEFQRVLALRPQSREALSLLGVISLRTRKLDEARSYFDRAVALGGTDAAMEYNRACVEALSDNAGEAMKYLKSALGLGFMDKESLANDPDLARIRSSPDFQQVMKDFQRGEK